MTVHASQPDALIVRQFLTGNSSPLDYETVWQAMRQFTLARTPYTPDELWLLEHKPVYTLGQAGKFEHILNAGDIPVVKIDRGGQVTYHGPGQLMCYTLVDIKRQGLSVRDFVVLLEDCLIELLSHYGIAARGDRDAPGVYVDNKKIAALGLRVTHGRAYHGLCLNVDFDASPFAGVNPCGYQGMQVTQVSELIDGGAAASGNGPLLACLGVQFTEILAKQLGLRCDVREQSFDKVAIAE